MSKFMLFKIYVLISGPCDDTWIPGPTLCLHADGPGLLTQI